MESQSRRSLFCAACHERIHQKIAFRVDLPPTYIFLVSGVLGLGELSFSISFGTDAVDMLSPVSSVSPVL
jgi:hypothetical protein